MSDNTEWVSLGEAAEIIGVHPATVRHWAEQGDLPFERTPGGHRRFRRSDLEKWLAGQRVSQPTDAQLVVQSAVGRARLEMANRQALTGMDWHRQLPAEARDVMRREGLRLMDALITYLAHPSVSSGLETAREVGKTYGAVLREYDLTLVQALQGYFYFVDFLVEAVVQLAETAAHAPRSWGEMMRHVNRFTRETLLGMVGVYEAR